MNKKFKPYYYRPYIPFALISCLLALFLVISVTLAFFYNDAFATNSVTMSGQVVIKAVGKGENYDSIEDTSTSNLLIKLDGTYTVLMPNMPIEVYANCKVFRSTTKPMLRAKVELLLIDQDAGDQDSVTIVNDLYDQFTDIILTDDDWIKYTVSGEDEEYFYYVGSREQLATEGDYGDYFLEEIDVTSSDKVIPFIDQPILFPYYATSEHSGLRVQIKIIFQAIQNYIPDPNGIKMNNTIDNAQRIFKHFNNTGVSGTTPS